MSLREIIAVDLPPSFADVVTLIASAEHLE